MRPGVSRGFARASLGLLLASAFTLAGAAAPDTRTLLQALVQCEAPVGDAVTFTERLDNGQVGLPVARQFEIPGGQAWTVKPAVSAMGVVSEVVVLTGRRGFYVVGQSPHPADAIRRLALAQGLSKSLDEGKYQDYQKDVAQTTLQAISLDDSHYLVGCFYSQSAFDRERTQRFNASPARVAQKKALLDILHDSQ